MPAWHRRLAARTSQTEKPEDTVATTNDIKNGTVLKLEGQLWNIIEFQHVKPGKGGAFVRTKMRNVMSGKVVDKTFNAGLKIETATVDRRDYQYLYQDGADFVFMDTAGLRPAHRPRRNRRRRHQLHARKPDGQHRHPRRQPAVHRAARRALSSRSPTPSRACRATAPRPAPSPPPWKPATRSRCRCSSRTTPRSRSTPATAATSAGSTTSERTRQGPEPGPGCSFRGGAALRFGRSTC